MSFGPVLGWFVLAGFLAGAAVAVLNPPLPARVILGSAGLIVFAGTIIAGITFTGHDGVVMGPVFGVRSAAGWLGGLLAGPRLPTYIAATSDTQGLSAPRTPWRTATVRAGASVSSS